MEIQAVAQQIYAPVLVSLQAVDSCFPRNLPNHLELDEGILGLLLINRKTKKCVISRNVDNSEQGKRQVNHGHRLDILKTFHNQAVDELVQGGLKTKETYWSSDYYKLHALAEGENLICVMYTAGIPIHTMRLISKETLRLILKEGDLCF